MKYYIDKTLHCSFEDAVNAVKNVLPNHGFGVVTEFDINEKLKEKLNVDFRKYKVIGACNPTYAYEALQAEPLIGTMLPCNIIVQKMNDNEILVAAIDPEASMLAVENTQLKAAAKEVKIKIEAIINAL